MFTVLLIVVFVVSTGVVRGVVGNETNSKDELIKCLTKQVDLVDKCSQWKPCNNGHTKSAFSAQLSHTLNNPASHSKLPFGKIKTNVGGNFDNTGVYTVPRDGTYFFTWTIEKNNGGVCLTEIVLNGNKVGYANHTGSKKGNVNKTSTQNVVLSLKKGDRIWIRMKRKGTVCFAAGWESFAGFEL